jgi:hypothetical protein
MDARALSNRPIDEQLDTRRRPLAPLFLALGVLAGLASVLAAKPGSARGMWERMGGLLAEAFLIADVVGRFLEAAAWKSGEA